MAINKSTNKYLASELVGLKVFGGYGAGATAGAEIQKLIDLISPEHTQEHRGMLDQMSPEAHRQLLVELLALQTAVGLYDAP